MKATGKWSATLSGTIFSTVLLFTTAVIVVISISMTAFYYFSVEHEAEARLRHEAIEIAHSLNRADSSESVSILREQFEGIVRYTLIDPAGTVLFDSEGEDELENHANRPEVQQALQSGSGSISRYSSTLNTDTIYGTALLNNGDVLRLAETRESLFSFAGNFVVLEVAVLISVALMALLLSRLLTLRIMKPINALDFTDPLENRIFKEMYPLLERIDSQQKQLMEQNKDLAQAESLRRDFSANVSHEMKTPLQVISGYAELMKNGLIDPQDVRKFSEVIYDESQAMRSLINDVLILSQLDETAYSSDSITRVDILTVAERVAERLRPLAQKTAVSIHIQGSSAQVLGKETLIETMLYNLVENAVRYNYENGRVELTIMKNESSEPAGTASPNSHQVEIRVSNTGPGIPADKLDKIFERFYRVDKSRSKETGGTGLGLAIVKHVAQYHGGTVEVQSEEGEGATFIVRLPLMN